jgi:hypothetical protein
MMRIEGVVEIEHPGVDMGEEAALFPLPACGERVAGAKRRPGEGHVQ